MVDPHDISHLEPLRKVGDIYITGVTLGRGKNASVYLGYIKSKENRVAIKLMTKESLEDEQNFKVLMRELDNLKELKHDNINCLVDLAQTDKNLLICIEYCKNGTLSNYLSNKEITTKLIMKISKEIIEGFRFLYNKKIVHRDIKPENILVDDKETMKISDFGFSRVLEENEKAGTFNGTPHYSCFEIFTQIPYTSKCDVFSVGVVLFEAAFQHHPFNPKKEMFTVKLLNSKFKQIPEIEVVFPKEPAFSENYKQMIRGMLRVKEEDRLGWPAVFDMMDSEIV